MNKISASDDHSEFTRKYEKVGRIGGALIDGFYSGVRELLEPRLQAGMSMIEVGCGAGYSTNRLRQWLPSECTLLSSDVSVSLTRSMCQMNAGTPGLVQSAYALALPDKSIDVVVMMEVLEHLEHPAFALKELKRVARHGVLISTPREPIWRMLNMCRGKYLSEFGNTPGHIQHWSSRGLIRLLGDHMRVVDVRRPLPWTIVLLAP